VQNFLLSSLFFEMWKKLKTFSCLWEKRRASSNVFRGQIQVPENKKNSGLFQKINFFFMPCHQTLLARLLFFIPSTIELVLLLLLLCCLAAPCFSLSFFLVIYYYALDTPNTKALSTKPRG
jgi:hypothetical protein